jgi:hypothetical protein
MATSLAYEPDTIVIDEPQRGRVPTEELTVHVYVESTWHRRLPDLSATSCGSRYHSQFSPVRREELKHPLCRGCFTPLELARADAAEVERDH